MRPPLALLALALTLALPASRARAADAPAGDSAGTRTAALTAPAPRPATPGLAHVTYLAGGSVYVDAGRGDGLREGDTLAVAAAGVVRARLRVAFLATHRASCDTLPGSALPKVGDAVRFTPHIEAPPPAAALPAPGSAVVPAGRPAQLLPAPATALIPNPPRSAFSRFRGRIGTHLLAIQSREAGDLTQPAVDARIEAVNAGGLPVDVLADVRGRRTIRSLTVPDDEGTSTRVYRMAVSLHDFSTHHRLTIGRQASPLLSSVSLFDGGLAEWGSSRWGVGAFSGTQPDPVRLTMSGEILQSGLYLEAHQAPMSTRRWSTAFGGVTSTDHGQVNRDFLFAQTMYNDPIVSFAFAQEADIERGWRRDSVGTPFSLTSTFATLNVRASEDLSVNVGYDGRRNVMLYRDRETPETAFDDQFRQGGWIGMTMDVGRHARFSGDARSMGTTADHVNTWSGSGELLRLTRVNGRVRARFSKSDAVLSRDQLVAFGGGLDPFDGAHVELDAGDRHTTDVLSGVVDRALWVSGDLDMSLLRRWLFSLSWEHTVGDLEHVDQEYAGLSVRF